MSWTTDSEAHEAIGRFTCHYETVCTAITSCIREIFFNQGLENKAVQDIILAGKTAAPLLTLLRHLVGETLVHNATEKKLCGRVFKEIGCLIELRNELIHANWLIFLYGRGDDQPEAVVTAQKLYANSNGSANKSLNLTQAYCIDLEKRCTEARWQFCLIQHCIRGTRDITDCFSFEGKGKNEKLIVHYDVAKPTWRKS